MFRPEYLALTVNRMRTAAKARLLLERNEHIFPFSIPHDLHRASRLRASVLTPFIHAQHAPECILNWDPAANALSSATEEWPHSTRMTQPFSFRRTNGLRNSQLAVGGNGRRGPAAAAAPGGAVCGRAPATGEARAEGGLGGG